jgi:uncharacterized membrane protein (UPF0127 family)
MKILFFYVIFGFLFPLFHGRVYAAYDPLSVPNNKVGVHILDTSEVFQAALLVNSNGGQWGYVTIPLRSDDRNRQKWINFFTACGNNKVIPIIRMATYNNGDHWVKPDIYDLLDDANFLNDMPWPVKNRYLVLYNEPNHAKEWGNSVSPEEYALLVTDARDIFKSRSDDFYIISAGLDMSAPTSGSSLDALKYFQQMSRKVPGWYEAVDGLAFHAYPNPGFTASVNSQSRYGITSYRYEINYLKSLGYSPKPIFLTETGYLGSSEFYRTAFGKVWVEKNIVAVTPFVLFAGAGDFTPFSLLDISQQPTPAYNDIFNLPKISGSPLLNNPPAQPEIYTGSFQSASASSKPKSNIIRRILDMVFPPQPQLIVGKVSIQVEVADTPQSVMRGLSGRKSLPETSGMLFNFPNSQLRTFWMKDMMFPLDFVWINNGLVVQITENAPFPKNALELPFTITSGQPVDRVLEVNAGFVSRNSIRVGDSVMLNSR